MCALLQPSPSVVAAVLVAMPGHRRPCAVPPGPVRPRRRRYAPAIVLWQPPPLHVRPLSSDHRHPFVPRCSTVSSATAARGHCASPHVSLHHPFARPPRAAFVAPRLLPCGRRCRRSPSPPWSHHHAAPSLPPMAASLSQMFKP
ncbi:hypothetical protein SESBI_38808 [Sesbania bispinosa]|nr:hypothetical protein SESBI_38808 [Sesbania bispinosa]